MKKFTSILTIVTLVFISSCGLISDLIPDVDTEFSKKFSVMINSASGTSASELIDVENSEEYNEFKDNIHGYIINDIRFEITNFNAPADLYFTGAIIAESEDGAGSVTAGSIGKVLLGSIADDGVEHAVDEVVAGTEQIAAWLEAPGKFVAMVSYQLAKADGSPYPTEGKGYGFDMKIILDVTVETGVGKN
jgi:hypothetical protein